MTDSVAESNASDWGDREANSKRNDRIFRSLPPLDSPEYLQLLKTATAAELPASVLVQAYRKSFPSPAAVATLKRLLCSQERYGYLDVLYKDAHGLRSRLGAYGVEDLVQNTIGEIAVRLGEFRGSSAERLWTRFVSQCMHDAYRKLVGRRNQRLEKRAKETAEDRADGFIPPRAIPWHGCVAPDRCEWLENFLHQTGARIINEEVRAIAMDLISDTPTPVSGKDPNDPNTLAGRFGVHRNTIRNWQEEARGIFFGALEAQNECEIDLSFLKRAWDADV